MDLSIYRLMATSCIIWGIRNTPTASQAIGYIFNPVGGQRSRTDSSILDEHATSGFFPPDSPVMKGTHTEKGLEEKSTW